jgi:lysophospholipase L1-like esterase
MQRYSVAALIALLILGCLPSRLNLFTPTHTVIIGDSIVQQMLPFQHLLPYPISDAQNLGVSGETSRMIARRLANVLDKNVQHVFIEGGVNDFMYGSDDEIVGNYKLMIETVSDGTAVYLIGILPVDMAALINDFRQRISLPKIRKINNDIRILCKSYANCHWIPNFESKDMSGMTTDGLHLNYRGYLALGNAISVSASSTFMP